MDLENKIYKYGRNILLTGLLTMSSSLIPQVYYNLKIEENNFQYKTLVKKESIYLKKLNCYKKLNNISREINLDLNITSNYKKLNDEYLLFKKSKDYLNFKKNNLNYKLNSIYQFLPLFTFGLVISLLGSYIILKKDEK